MWMVVYIPTASAAKPLIPGCVIRASKIFLNVNESLKKEVGIDCVLLQAVVVQLYIIDPFLIGLVMCWHSLSTLAW